jgi:hypothetical protein
MVRPLVAAGAAAAAPAVSRPQTQAALAAMARLRMYRLMSTHRTDKLAHDDDHIPNIR